MIIPFPGTWHGETLGERRVLVAVVDDTVVGELPAGRVAMDSQLAVRYIRPGQADWLAREPDLWIESRAPSAPDRRVLYETLANEIVEQDERGTLWIDGCAFDGGPLIRLGDAERDAEGALAPGSSAALLLMSRDGARYRFTVEVSSPVLWVFEQPKLLADEPVLLGWTGVAHCLWEEREGRAR